MSGDNGKPLPVEGQPDWRMLADRVEEMFFCHICAAALMF